MARSVSKKHKDALQTIEKGKLYTIAEASELVKKTSYVKFDATVEVALRLGVDPRKAEQNLRGALVLPHGTGKTRTVLVIAQGDKAKEAEEAGADYVGEDDLLAKIQGGWFDFDVIVATPDMMPKLGRLGRVLGPKGLMPNPKTGTVTVDIAKAVEEIKAGKVEYRVDKAGNVHVPVGKVSFDADKLADNIKAVVDTMIRIKPSTTKGTYIKSLTITSTMGPGIKVDPEPRLNKILN